MISVPDDMSQFAVVIDALTMYGEWVKVGFKSEEDYHEWVKVTARLREFNERHRNEVPRP